MKRLCGITDELLVDYIYEEIEDAAKLAEIEAHVKNCALCAAELKQLDLVKKASKNADIDFSGDIWAMHKQGVLRKLAKKENVLMNLRVKVLSVFDFKVLGLAALILMFTGAGMQYYRVVKATQDQKAMAGQMELLQNFEIIERLDFYEKISKK